MYSDNGKNFNEQDPNADVFLHKQIGLKLDMGSWVRKLRQSFVPANLTGMVLLYNLTRSLPKLVFYEFRYGKLPLENLVITR